MKKTANAYMVLILIVLSLCLTIKNTSEVTPILNTKTCSLGSDPNCGLCYFGRCILCWYTYPDEQGICQTTPTKVDKCTVYSSKTQCEGCEDGYTLNKDNNTCKEQTIEHCVIEQNGKCTKCKNYLEQDGKCQEKCSENCLWCTKPASTIICTDCEVGYNNITTLGDLLGGNIGNCSKGGSSLANCVAKEGVCKACAPGFYVTSQVLQKTTCSSVSTFWGISISTIFTLMAFRI